LLTDLEKLAAK